MTPAVCWLSSVCLFPVNDPLTPQVYRAIALLFFILYSVFPFMMDSWACIFCVAGCEGHAVPGVAKVRAPGPRRQERPRRRGHDAQDRRLRTRKVGFDTLNWAIENEVTSRIGCVIGLTKPLLQCGEREYGISWAFWQHETAISFRVLKLLRFQAGRE